MDRMHRVAAAGFEAAAGAYEQGRPDYPDDAVAWLVHKLRIRPGDVLLDLGAGTGKLTRLLTPTGAQVIAVEPVAAMRQKLIEVLPDVKVLDATIEALPLPTGGAVAAVAAQSFHWFCNPTALGEIHRVLRPAGRLGLLWNYRDESAPWVARLNRLIGEIERQVPSYRSGQWRAVFEQTQLFGPLHERTFQHTQTGDLETMLARVSSISFVATLAEDRRAKLMDEVRVLFATLPQPIVFPYTTHAYWCERMG